MNISEAKTHLSRLIARAVRGEEIILAKDGRPVAKIVPLIPHVAHRTPGTARGKIRIGPKFDAPLSKDVQKRFE